MESIVTTRSQVSDNESNRIPKYLGLAATIFAYRLTENPYVPLGWSLCVHINKQTEMLTSALCTKRKADSK